ncbi:MAG: hypothetical protein M1358_01950 [Chloroflexi bacterium]|nr:hypothetical protein [Chloroflexota bacterium]
MTSNQPVVAVVNEVHSSGSAISYNGFPAGGNLVNLPTVLNNAYGGWTTGVSIQNTSTSPGSGTITYYNANGTKAGEQSINLLPRGSIGLYQGAAGLSDGWAGSAVISTTTTVVAIVNEVPTSGDAMGYGGVVTGETEVNLPAVMDNAYGGWNTGMGIQNTATGSVGVTVTYYDTGGTQIGSAIGKTIPARGYWGLYQGGTLGGGAGSAKIVATGPVAVIVNEIGPGGSAISYNGSQ